MKFSLDLKGPVKRSEVKRRQSTGDSHQVLVHALLVQDKMHTKNSLEVASVVV